MKSYKISVIIPVYNEEKYIADCLYSFNNQTLQPSEVIVVDDGSTDNSKYIIYNLKFKINNLKYVRQKHSGPAKARNMGSRYAKGNILVFVDADMKFDKKYLENLTKPIRTDHALATFTKEEYVANPESVWSRCWSINSYLPDFLHIDPNTGSMADNFRAIRHDIFQKTEGYKDIGYGEDVTVLAQLKGVRAKAAPFAICYHFNPSTLAEVFFSARWIGKSYKKNIKHFLIYSFPNTLRKGVIGAIKNRLPEYLIFKFVFDFGIAVGQLQSLLGGGYAK